MSAAELRVDRAECRAEGICANCRKYEAPAGSCCAACREGIRARKAGKRADHKCLECSAPTKASRCDACAAVHRARYRGKPTSAARLAYSRGRRRVLREAGLCINGKSHGERVEGHTKCARCVETHKRSR